MSQDRLDAVMADFAQGLAGEKFDDFYTEVDDIGLTSPIEIMMGAALVFCLTSKKFFGQVYGYRTCFGDTYCDSEFKGIGRNGWSHPYIIVVPQMRIGAYRADFYVEFRHWQSAGICAAVIECDGHDFHDRTKEQAAHDKRRDRNMQALGLMVLRYPGSEIYSNPLACASGALRLVEARALATAKTASA